MAHAECTRASASRLTHLVMTAAVVLGIAGCGGSTGSGGNDGEFVSRTGVAITGIADDGTATSPIAGGQCSAVSADGRVLSTDVTGDDGSFLLLMDPGQTGSIRCTASGQSLLVLRRFVSTEGLAEGADLGGQDVLPATTLVSRIVAREVADDPDLDARARFRALMARLEPFGSGETPGDVRLQLLADVATLAYDRLRDAGVDLEFEAVLADLHDDGDLDLEAAAELAEEVDAEIAALATAAGSTVPAAVLATHPGFTLSVLNVGGGQSALSNVARLGTVLERARERAAAAGGALALASGDMLESGLELLVSLEATDDFRDARALDLLQLDALGVGARDLELGPNQMVNLVDALESDLVTVLTDVDVDQDANFAELVNQRRVTRALVREERARRIGIVAATDPELARLTSVRRLLPVADNESRIARIQGGVDGAREAGARIIVLLSSITEQADLATLMEGLSGVDLIVALPGAPEVALPAEGTGPFPVAPTMLVDAEGAEVSLVPGLARYEGVFRLETRFDPLGRLVDGTTLVEAERIAGADAADPTPEEPQLRDEVVTSVQEAIAGLGEVQAAEVRVELDTRLEALSRGESNWGNLVADGVLRAARSNASLYDSTSPVAALVDAGSLAGDTPIAAGDLSRLQLLEPVRQGQVVGVLQTVGPEVLKVLLEASFADLGGERFAQVSGLEIVFDPDGTAQVRAADGSVSVPGTRVVEVRITDGDTLIRDGAPVADARSISLAVSERLRRELPLGDAVPINVGTTLLRALDTQVRSSLDGVIRSDDYPVEGEGRIRVVDEG
jgi:2',3'-cyclic-nucleotide 2'-phosphodiesterase (5'-nucleotidase family)